MVTESEMEGGRPQREGFKWKGMETEIKQRQDTNQHNAMANDTAENKTKEKKQISVTSCSLLRPTPYTPGAFL